MENFLHEGNVFSRVLNFLLLLFWILFIILSRVKMQILQIIFFSTKMLYFFKKNNFLRIKELICLNCFYDSYAIGGLSGGEDKDIFWRVVAQCTAALPEDKPRYVMVLILCTHCIFIFCYVIILQLIFFSYLYKHTSFAGCWLSAWYHSLQCFGCRHVWLCLSYTYCTLWYSTNTWGRHVL